MKTLILAPGAVGVYFGGRLARSGAEVSVVARRDYDVASAHGYAVESIRGDFHFTPRRVLKSVAETDEVFDYVFVTAKAFADSVALLRGAVRSRETAIVLIQNGIGNEKAVKEAYPDNELISSVAYIGVSRPEPGKVLHQGSGILKMGVYPSGPITPKLRDLAAAFEKAGVECTLFEDIQRQRWDKLLWNISYNVVSVLAGGVDTQGMTKKTAAGKVCSALMDDLIAVANACGVALSRADAERQIEYNENFPAYKTSMLQDFEAHRPLEIEPILGNAMRLAREHAVFVPAIGLCYNLLIELDRKNTLKNA
ncbi:MAG: 2-dehydropantoate 2-reductase [Victivallaceae bacterium]|nr:2-dehydropantoate 2-reductase [Victivallaceae bacterium]